MKIVVNMFQDEVVDKNNNTKVSKDFDSSTKETKKLVTLICENENKNKFVISKWLTISSSKSDDDYVKEAHDASKSEIDTWSASFTNIGKTFNPDTGKME